MQSRFTLLQSNLSDTSPADIRPFQYLDKIAISSSCLSDSSTPREPRVMLPMLAPSEAAKSSTASYATIPSHSFIDDEKKLLVIAYLFGYSYRGWTFSDAAIEPLIYKVIYLKRTPILHSLLDLNINCASSYPLKMLIAHLATYTWSDDQFCGLSLAHRPDTRDHVRFWADVGDYHAMHKTNSYALPTVAWRKNPCHYHVHASYLQMNYTCYVQKRRG